jgi:hypothetical protein
MEIVITQVTRMSVGFICVAGIDPQTGRHVRPVTGYGRLTTAMLGRNGGPFELGRRVDLGPTRSVGSPPEVEDQLFRPEAVRVVREATATELARLLGAAGSRSLVDIFGNDFVAQGRTAAVETGHGKASLGCLLPSDRPRLVLEYGKVKISLADDALRLVVSVTDLQLYGDDHSTPDATAVDRMNADLARTPAYINVGLSRPFVRPGDTVERHWLQTNTISFDRAG